MRPSALLTAWLASAIAVSAAPLGFGSLGSSLAGDSLPGAPKIPAGLPETPKLEGAAGTLPGAPKLDNPIGDLPGTSELPGGLPEIPKLDNPTGELPGTPKLPEVPGSLPETPNVEDPTGGLPKTPTLEDPAGSLPGAPDLSGGLTEAPKLPELPGSLPEGVTPPMRSRRRRSPADASIDFSEDSMPEGVAPQDPIDLSPEELTFIKFLGVDVIPDIHSVPPTDSLPKAPKIEDIPGKVAAPAIPEAETPVSMNQLPKAPKIEDPAAPKIPDLSGAAPKNPSAGVNVNIKDTAKNINVGNVEVENANTVKRDEIIPSVENPVPGTDGVPKVDVDEAASKLEGTVPATKGLKIFAQKPGQTSVIESADKQPLDGALGGAACENAQEVIESGDITKCKRADVLVTVDQFKNGQPLSSTVLTPNENGVLVPEGAQPTVPGADLPSLEMPDADKVVVTVKKLGEGANEQTGISGRDTTAEADVGGSNVIFVLSTDQGV
ncbi:hypothetical protein TWF481_009832 [Arthrobotrys musiformis]|uniref:Uncharacterized protein n=1 Tax=Arthrobotrys musiformis TaxID=47236 RepID=A0AAV9W6B4_9PEZI